MPSAFLEAVNPICLTIFAATVLLWSRRRFLELGCVQRYPPFSAGHWLVVALTRPPVHPLPVGGTRHKDVSGPEL